MSNSHVILCVDDEPQVLEALARLGATKAQGYLFARPMSAKTLVSWHSEFIEPLARHRGHGVDGLGSPN